jgi:hypothetical protein
MYLTYVHLFRIKEVIVLCGFSPSLYCLVAAFESYTLETLRKIKFGPNAELQDNNLDCKMVKVLLRVYKININV